ncbi:MAG: hypothetical protein IJW71_05570 [Clostridia bacterium]|nr:hypothetical protein [Clostridia bacterium]
MTEARSVFNGEADKRAYVLECEARYERRLDAAVGAIISSPASKLIALSGPSASGKTTTANKLIAEFTERGKQVHVISIDDYYYNRDFLIEMSDQAGEPLDFDSPSTIDLSSLKITVEQIFSGKNVVVPTFDFNSGTRTGYREFLPNADSVFLFEGIQAVYPEVTTLFNGHPYTGIFVSVAEGLKIGQQTFFPEELRFMRRLVRDFNFRSAAPDFTFKLWQSVRKNEEKNILPYAKTCAVHLNSLLEYEVATLRPYVMPLLSSIGKGSPFYENARDILKKLKHIENISREYIPKESLCREFLG